MRLGIIGTRMFLAVALLGQMSLVVFGQSPNPHAAEPATKSAETKSPAAAKPAVTGYLSAAELRMKQDVSYLAADAREGRGPGTAGIDDAANYIADEFKRIGLKPADDQSRLEPDLETHQMSHRRLCLTLRRPKGAEIMFPDECLRRRLHKIHIQRPIKPGCRSMGERRAGGAIQNLIDIVTRSRRKARMKFIRNTRHPTDANRIRQ